MLVSRRLSALVLALLPAAALAAELCTGFGPKTPRDISATGGTNTRLFAFAPAAGEMNLCDIHTHTNAEHKGPGFSVSGGEGEHGGWKCTETDGLTDAELAPAAGAYGNVKSGDTIQVHWVYTTCPGTPGPGLGSCMSDACVNPQLRVESQVFLLVNDPQALDFADFAHAGNTVNGLYQPRSLPAATGDPLVFLGSTTGPSYTEEQCSPFQVTWSVRPACAKLDIGSLHAWAEGGNVFDEEHSHGVRQLVTSPQLLSPID